MVAEDELSVYFAEPADLGIVIWCLKLGCPVPLPALADAKVHSYVRKWLAPASPKTLMNELDTLRWKLP